jgi:hypothetical protein
MKKVQHECLVDTPRRSTDANYNKSLAIDRSILEAYILLSLPKHHVYNVSYKPRAFW